MLLYIFPLSLFARVSHESGQPVPQWLGIVVGNAWLWGTADRLGKLFSNLLLTVSNKTPTSLRADTRKRRAKSSGFCETIAWAAADESTSVSACSISPVTSNTSIRRYGNATQRKLHSLQHATIRTLSNAAMRSSSSCTFPAMRVACVL